MYKSIGLIAGLLLSVAATAAPFQNGGFESGATLPTCNLYNQTGTVMTGWNIYIGNIDWESSGGCGWIAASGGYSIDVIGDSTGGIGGIEQTFDTIPGVVYLVEFAMAGNPGGLDPPIKPLAVTVAGNTTNFSFDVTGHSSSSMGWTTKSLQFTATSASTTIQFVSDISANCVSCNAGAALDDVRIGPLNDAAPAVAVPMTGAAWIAMLLLAFAAVGLRRRG
ncbi:MAG: choice-of-anchor C family protein [Casimicrobiaceae bacterium]